jgi:hypothetical protein
MRLRLLLLLSSLLLLLLAVRPFGTRGKCVLATPHNLPALTPTFKINERVLLLLLEVEWFLLLLSLLEPVLVLLFITTDVGDATFMFDLANKKVKECGA